MIIRIKKLRLDIFCKDTEQTGLKCDIFHLF